MNQRSCIQGQLAYAQLGSSHLMHGQPGASWCSGGRLPIGMQMRLAQIHKVTTVCARPGRPCMFEQTQVPT